MHVQRIGKHNYVFGLRWVAPIKAGEGVSDVKLLRSLGLGRNSPVFGIKAIGNTIGIYGKRKIKDGISVAALLAISHPSETIIVTVAIADDVAWFCAVNKGEVISGADIASDHDEIMSQSSTFYNLFPNCKRVELESIDAFFELIDKSKIDLASISEITKIKFKQAIVGVVTAAIAAGIIFILWPKPEHMSTPIVTAKKTDPKTQALTVLKSKPDPLELVIASMGVIKKQHRMTGGWVFSSIAYSSKRLRLTWTRKYAIDAHELFKHVPQAVLSFDGNMAVVDGQLTPGKKERITILNVNQFIQAMLPITQELKLHGTTLQYKLPVNKSAISRLVSSSDFKTGKWAASGKGLSFLQHDATVLANGGSMMVDTMMVKLNDNITWKMEGDYVVKY